MRLRELDDAVRIIGYDALYLLGYRDSGMPDTEPNAHPDNFANADLDEATGRLVEIVRRERPQVIVGYARDRVYAHPDHVRVHEISVLAFERAGDPEWYPELGRAVAAAEALLQQRLHPAAHPRRCTTGSSRRARRARWPSGSSTWTSATPRRAEPTSRRHDDALEQVTTTRIDVRDQIEVGRAALLAHRTQIPPDSFFFRVPLEVEQELHPWEEYVLARTLVDTGRGRGRVRDRPVRGAPGRGELLSATVPPDEPEQPEPERSELDEALFSSTEPDHTPTRGRVRREPTEDLSSSTPRCSASSVRVSPRCDAAEIPPDGLAARRSGPGGRFGLGVPAWCSWSSGSAVLAYAVLGRRRQRLAERRRRSRCAASR